MAVNAHAPAAMAEACAARGARFLHVSTDYVFGGDAPAPTPLTETDPPAPVNVYGLSKLFGETLAALAAPTSPSFASPRSSGCAAPAARAATSSRR